MQDADQIVATAHEMADAAAAAILPHFRQAGLAADNKRPEGFDPAIEAAADEKISFSRMTFNHQIIRIMILEQLYRAFTIIRGEHYHK